MLIVTGAVKVESKKAQAVPTQSVNPAGALATLEVVGHIDLHDRVTLARRSASLLSSRGIAPSVGRRNQWS